MSSFVLVHDAWHGAWYWDGVKSRLEKAGEGPRVSCVLAPDLPGHGTRMADERRNITVEDYVSSITTQIGLARMSDVVLVGHGLAAFYLPLVVQQVEDAVRRVVFVAGLFPPEGKSPLEERPVHERALAWLFNAREKGFWLPAPLLRYLLGLDSMGQSSQSVLSRLTPDPVTPWTTPARYGSFPGQLPTTYVLLKQDRFITPSAQSRYAALVPNVNVEELDAGHECPLTHPQELAALLLKCAD